MDIYEAIKTRKSVRSYENRAVTDEVLTRILNAARLAPSANNFQEWRFVVERNEGGESSRARKCPAAWVTSA